MRNQIKWLLALLAAAIIALSLAAECFGPPESPISPPPTERQEFGILPVSPEAEVE